MRLPRCQAIAILALAVLLIAAGVPTGAQTAERVYRLGFLGQTSARDLDRQITALREGLRALGYEPGRNLVIESRWAERKLERLPALAAELVAANVDVIVTHGSPGSRAAKHATNDIPIVLAVVGDPVANGVVASLARPGGNVTGLVLQELDTTVKWFQLVKELQPAAAVLGLLDVPGIEETPVADAARRDEDTAASSRGLSIHRVLVRHASDLPQAFETLARRGAHAVVVPNSSLLNPLGVEIAGLAIKHRLPSVGALVFARAGGLLGFGPDGADMYRRAAGYVDKILKGARAGDLPMEGPAKFELLVNLKTARAIGAAVPRGLLGRADTVID